VSLSDWQKSGWLIEHRASRQEIKQFLQLIDRDLADCRTPSLSPDWRFNIAYNAALQCAQTALAASGFRAAKDGHHYRIIQSLKLTLKVEDKIIRKLDAFRKKRNISEYNQAGSVTEIELNEMIALADQLRKATDAWLVENFPDLRP